MYNAALTVNEAAKKIVILSDDTCQPFVFKTNPQPSLLSYFNHSSVLLQRDNLKEEFHNQIG